MNESPTITTFIKEIYNIWITDRPARLAAGLAYYGMFSLAPITYIALTIAGVFIDELAMADRMFTVLNNVVGPETAAYIEASVLSLEQTTSGGTFFTSFISFVALLMAASGVFFNLQTSLNTIWHIPPPEKGGTKALIIDRLVSFVMVIGVGVLLIIAATVVVVLNFLDTIIRINLPVQIVNQLVVILLSMLSISLLYKILPDAKITWRDVWLGAGITTLVMVISAYVFGWYLTSSNINSAFEAAGTVAVILIGIYTIAQIFLFGAVFTRVYANMFGSLSSNIEADTATERDS